MAPGPIPQLAEATAFRVQPFPSITCSSAAAMPLLGVYAAVTIFHNVQYHRLVWFYNQNKYGHDFRRALGNTDWPPWSMPAG